MFSGNICATDDRQIHRQTDKCFLIILNKLHFCCTVTAILLLTI